VIAKLTKKIANIDAALADLALTTAVRRRKALPGIGLRSRGAARQSTVSQTIRDVL
jgi:hypothetical protein